VTNFGEHLLRRVIEDEQLYYRLEARPKLVAGAFVPGIGLADPLEMASVPQLNHIVDAVRTVVAERA
jgi:2-oxoisovalerate dehydrogenase E1 component beta subunit